MPTLSQHRFLMLTLFLATLVALLARPLTVLFVTLRAPKELPVSASRIASPKPAAVTIKSEPLMKNKVAVIKEANGLSLKPMTREFTSIVSGRTLCAGEPCAATLKVTIEPDGLEKPVMLTIQSLSDGTYQLLTNFQALPNSQLDWKVTAVSEDLLMGDTHGRQILSDDAPIIISSDINQH